MDAKKARTLLITGIVGCMLYVTGDFLYAATGSGQTTETMGLMVKVAYLDMATWRMAVSILCGFAGTLLYYMGFSSMHRLLEIHLGEGKNRVFVKLFRLAYITGTVAWTYVHAMFMNEALTFRFIYERYGEMQEAADIVNRVFLYNAVPMVIAFALCDAVLTVIMIIMVWKRIIPLKNTGMRILATLCNPLMLPAVVGNLFALLPWPLNQIDHGTESAGHALVLVLGLVLLNAMERTGEFSGEKGKS